MEHTWGSADLGPTPPARQSPCDLTQHSLPGLPLSIWEAGLTPLFLGSGGGNPTVSRAISTRQGLGKWGNPLYQDLSAVY